MMNEGVMDWENEGLRDLWSVEELIERTMD